MRRSRHDVDRAALHGRRRDGTGRCRMEAGRQTARDDESADHPIFSLDASIATVPSMSPTSGDESRDGVALTNLDQPLFDGADATKRDLVEYLDAVRDRIIPVLQDRLL